MYLGSVVAGLDYHTLHSQDKIILAAINLKIIKQIKSPAWYGVQLVKEGRSKGRDVTECPFQLQEQESDQIRSVNNATFGFSDLKLVCERNFVKNST